MPLITCPDCQVEISDTAPSCIKCGRPMEEWERNAIIKAQKEKLAQEKLAKEKLAKKNAVQYVILSIVVMMLVIYALGLFSFDLRPIEEIKSEIEFSLPF